MSFLNNIFLGVRIFIWIYFSISLIYGLSVIIFWYRERIRKRYYEFRFPEKLLKVVIHYVGNQYKEFWRLIPDDNLFTFESKKYSFSDKTILKDNEFFIKQDNNRNVVIIDGKKYSFEDLKIVRKRKSIYPEVHYFYNNPTPINFDFEKKDVGFSSKELNDFEENDLFKKLLTLEDEKRLMMLIMILTIVNTIATVFVIAKLMEWI